MSKTLLAYVATRYEEAHATSDQLRQRAFELIVAACVTEWRHSLGEVASSPLPPSSEPLPEWSEDEVPKIDYDELASRPDERDEDVDVPPATPDTPQEGPERTEEQVWWTSPSEPAPKPPPAEPMRGMWEPPPRS